MSGNPWLDEDDSATQRKPNRWADEEEEDFDPNKDYLTQVVKRKESDMLASTNRSLGMIYESEQIGAATGEELIRQGEALRRTEGRVDQMEQDLKESDRHIQSIKSLWGAFVNKFKKAPVPTAVTNYDDSPSESSLHKAVGNSKVSGYRDDDYDNHPVLARQEQSRRQFDGSRSDAKSDQMRQVDENLDHMLGGLSRLKALGIGLGEEIESQDKVLTRLTGKVQRVDDKTYDTNKKLIKLNKS